MDRPQLQEQMEDMDIAPAMQRKFLNFGKPGLSIQMEANPARESKPGRSKFGGFPDLPANLPWPQDAKGVADNFLLQINLLEVSELAGQTGLPPQGMLYFFYEDTRLDQPQHHAHVLFTPKADGLVAGAAAERKYSGQKADKNYQPAPVARIEFGAVNDFVMPAAAEVKDALGAEEFKIYQAFEEECKFSHDWVFDGTAFLSVMSDSARAAFGPRGNLNDWRILASIDPADQHTEKPHRQALSHFHLGRRVFFFIEKTKLQALDFSNVILCQGES